MFVDTHCHLNFHAFSQDIDQVLVRAKEANVTTYIIPGAKLDSSQKAIDLSNTFAGCFAAVGIHPHHCNEFTPRSEETISTMLLRFGQNKKTVAIGEIGLDNHQYQNYPPPSKDDKRKQRELFKLQLEVAKQLHLPVIIHNRDAQEEILSVLKTNPIFTALSGVFHCFEGDSNFLRTVLGYGFYIGVDGNITYKTNSHVREIVKSVPLDRLLIETDSPFLTPEPFRGKRNEPSFLTLTAQCIAEIHQIPLSEVAAVTTRNAVSLFRFTL